MQINRRIYIAVAVAVILAAAMVLPLIPERAEEPAAVPAAPHPTPTVVIETVEEPKPTEAPAITPPAESAASGSDIILLPVEPVTDSDLAPVGGEGSVLTEAPPAREES